MKIRSWRGAMIATAVLVGGAGALAFAAEQVAVEVKVLVIRSGKGSMYPPVAEAKQNDKLDVVGREADSWLRVSYGGKEGYVKDTALKPRGAVGLSGLAEGMTQMTGQTSDVGASAAARGIDDDARQYAVSKGMNPEPLNQMLRNRDRVAGERWIQFTNEGKVGPAKQK
ncbi:MAG TPA: SH3 domain-containing protein [Tepidisphaeraceae bacterium]|jgi:uncharacterized protein YgiM (DUF1202 family)